MKGPEMFTLTIDTANDAFNDAPERELARILRNVADKLETVGTGNRAPVRDVNGNTVGRWEISS